MLKLQDVRLNSSAQKEFGHCFASGTTTVVLGRNNSGKTDLCRLIAGLPSQASGQVVLAGVDITSQRPQQRSVALVYQAFVNYPNWTVAQNIASPMRAKGKHADYIQDRVQELAGKVGIGELLDRMPDELSGGQQQRVAIARALAKEASVLLLDEPLVNLDYKLREALEVGLRALLNDNDLVVIYTTSDPRDAFSLGDEVLLLQDHVKVQSGAPLDVYRAPVSFAAADLMDDPGVNRFSEGQELCAVRPEHLALALDEPNALSFRMQVTALETNGTESIVHGMVGQESWVMRNREMVHVGVGEELMVWARQQDILRFQEG